MADDEKPAPAPEPKEPAKKAEDKPKESKKPEAQAEEKSKEPVKPPKSEAPAEEKPKEHTKPLKPEAAVDTKPREPVKQAKPEVSVEEKPKEPARPSKPEAPAEERLKGPAEPAPQSAPEPGAPLPESGPVPVVKPKKKIPHTAKAVKVFGKYDISEVVVHDPGLQRYINIDPIIVPHTGARHANRWLGKSKINVVERVINGMMRTERFTGKKSKAYTAVRKALELVEAQTKTNPIQVLVDALENAAPREEVTRLKYGGISVPKAVDVSSSRRLDTAIRNICQGTVHASYKSTKRIEQCLANELVLAAKKDMNSFAVAKKEEVERVAGSAR
jgi:small subunit ribosomal protein S7